MAMRMIFLDVHDLKADEPVVWVQPGDMRLRGNGKVIGKTNNWDIFIF